MENNVKTMMLGTGVAIPPKTLTNQDLEKIVDTSDEWIRERTGMQVRHIVDDETQNSDLSAQAAKQALKDADMDAEEIDTLIVATVTGDVTFPATACYVQDKIGAVNAAAFPGGVVLVFTGLLDKMRSENELAFVLGHELGHFKNRDHLKGMGRLLVLLVGSVFVLGPDNALGNLALSSLNLAETGFSRRQESDADEFALKTLQCRYGHVGGATDFFATMMKEESGLKLFNHFFASHPDSQKRIDAMDQQADQAGYPQKATVPMPVLDKES